MVAFSTRISTLTAVVVTNSRVAAMSIAGSGALVTINDTATTPASLVMAYRSYAQRSCWRDTTIPKPAYKTLFTHFVADVVRKRLHPEGQTSDDRQIDRFVYSCQHYSLCR